jgi:hypothetical protein
MLQGKDEKGLFHGFILGSPVISLVEKNMERDT